ncbi:MAG: transposase [bacterium]|nr:transposase [bacterium]
MSRGSLSNWIGRVIDLLEPIYEAQLCSILSGQVVAMNETPIRAGRKAKAKAKGKMRTAYFWPVYGEQDEVTFPYAPSRAKRYVGEILGDFRGTLVSDGYEAYDRFASHRDEVVHALCWMHARRGFVKSEEVEPGLSEVALDQIGLLYEHEERIAAEGLSGREKLEVRACAPPRAPGVPGRPRGPARHQSPRARTEPDSDGAQELL